MYFVYIIGILQIIVISRFISSGLAQVAVSAAAGVMPLIFVVTSSALMNAMAGNFATWACMVTCLKITVTHSMPFYNMEVAIRTYMRAATPTATFINIEYHGTTKILEIPVVNIIRRQHPNAVHP